MAKKKVEGDKDVSKPRTSSLTDLHPIDQRALDRALPLTPATELKLTLSAPGAGPVRNSSANDINLRILETTETSSHRLPKWMRQYRKVSYCAYFLITCFSIGYLTLIGSYQADVRMQIQYHPILSYLEHNSYSILSPLLCPFLIGMLTYHVWKRVNLDEGDFFGILGFLLFFALINFHDGWAIMKLARTMKDSVVNIDHWKPDITSRLDTHWQYAWSTKPSCAKEYVRDLVYQHEYDKSHVKREILVEFGPDRERQLDEPTNSSSAPEGTKCDGYHDKKEEARVRGWMLTVQSAYKCCGPYGLQEWSQRFEDKWHTGCRFDWIINPDDDREDWEIPGCYKHLMNWVEDVSAHTCWVMMVQGILYIVAMILAVIHHTAMKLEEEVVAKRYSLLSLTDRRREEEDPWWKEPRPSEKPVIVGKYKALKPGEEAMTDDEEEGKDKNKDNGSDGGSAKGKKTGMFKLFKKEKGSDSSIKKKKPKTKKTEILSPT